MIWCTTERIHLDRVACLWLIERFVDPAAEFLFVPRGTTADGVTGVPIALPGAELAPHDESGPCFGRILTAYQLDDANLRVVNQVIAAALRHVLAGQVPQPDDRIGQIGVGLAAISGGLRELGDDHAILAASRPIYDALYVYLGRMTTEAS